jgi:hypothetical protein
LKREVVIMNIRIVTERRRHVFLLKALLRPELSALEKAGHEVAIVQAGGWSSAESLARSLLVIRQGPVALVVGLDEESRKIGAPDSAALAAAVREQERFLKQSLGAYADPNAFEVITIAPEIERLIAEEPVLVRALTGRAPTEEESAVLHSHPYEGLEWMLDDSVGGRHTAAGRDYLLTDLVEAAFEKQLPHLDLSRLRGTEEIRRLRAFLDALADAKQAEPAGAAR